MSIKETALSIFGAFLAVIIASFFSNIILNTTSHGAHIIIASTGASAILLFSFPYSEVSRAWNLIGGHTVSAIVGISCYKFIPDELIAIAVAIALAMFFMHLFKCDHPPGGATAITAVIGGQTIYDLGYAFVLVPIFFNSLILLTVAMAVATFRHKNPFIE